MIKQSSYPRYNSIQVYILTETSGTSNSSTEIPAHVLNDPAALQEFIRSNPTLLQQILINNPTMAEAVGTWQ